MSVDPGCGAFEYITQAITLIESSGRLPSAILKLGPLIELSEKKNAALPVLFRTELGAISVAF